MARNMPAMLELGVQPRPTSPTHSSEDAECWHRSRKSLTNGANILEPHSSLDIESQAVPGMS